MPRIGHVRICGGPRWATTPAYPTFDLKFCIQGD